jgi:hypothetical protein
MDQGSKYPETVKLLKEGAGNTLELIGIGNTTPAAQQLRERIGKWNFIKLKTSAQKKKWALN